jgi:hypothetical protein
VRVKEGPDALAPRARIAHGAHGAHRGDDGGHAPKKGVRV